MRKLRKLTDAELHQLEIALLEQQLLTAEGAKRASLLYDLQLARNIEFCRTHKPALPRYRSKSTSEPAKPALAPAEIPPTDLVQARPAVASVVLPPELSHAPTSPAAAVDRPPKPPPARKPDNVIEFRPKAFGVSTERRYIGGELPEWPGTHGE